MFTKDASISDAPVTSTARSAVELPADVRKWLLGDALVEEPGAVPQLSPGKYRLRTALLDPRTHKPAITLGIAGRTPDGWHDLGEISVEDNIVPTRALGGANR